MNEKNGDRLKSRNRRNYDDKRKIDKGMKILVREQF